MSRRPILLPLVAVAAAFLAAGSALAAPSICTSGCFAAPSGSGALFVFTGHGWGHGVGMSQYGAYGYAQHGWTAQQILDHYYPGTTVGKAPVSQIRVLLADRKATLSLGSDAPFTVTDGSGHTYALDPGAVTLRPSLSLVVGGRPQTLTPPLTFRPGTGAPLTLVRPYRGRIEVDVVDGKLRAIDVVPLEQYLYGVVASEMPATWSPEALKAQAVAARSYAIATRQVGAPYDVYSDTRSQMYLGISSEQPAATAAVDATKRQVLLYAGKVATTFFYSSSGGQTESAANWGATALPYLVSVPDPFDVISPYHDWGPVPITGKAIAQALKLPARPIDLRPTPSGTGRVANVDVVTPTSSVSVLATKLRGVLGLRSTWFDVGVLSLAPPAPNAPVTYGASVQLSGLVHGVAGVALEQRPAASTWQSVGGVTPAPDGTLTLTATPTITTDYRLATPAAAAGFVRIKVAPAVTITSATAELVQGTELPVLPGAPVKVQLQNADLTWSDAGTGTVGADGAWSVPVQLTPGAAYRVVVSPGGGYAPATTAQTVVR